MTVQHYDAIIIGAGISGISAAYHFQKNCPGKTYKILERREQLGGTWDLFNYPGIRSDSDMYTFGFSFRPWTDKAAIAEKHKIIDYLRETTEEYGIDQHMQYGVHIKKAEWSSDEAHWNISAESAEYSSQFVFMCVGYYNYDNAYAPEFAGSELFNGTIIHPQFWPEDFDYEGKRVAIIGSGATAVTLLPAMAEKAEHVTMLQRSPTYMGAKPAVDPIGNKIAKWFGHAVARWWFILHSMFIYAFCKLFPAKAKQAMIGDIKELLGDKFEAKHFTPNYQPWDQRVCLCPDGDFFEAMNADKASVVTDHIDTITENGIALKSGDHLDADVIVTATGLELLFLGGIELIVDGEVVDPSQRYIYKGFMCNGAPNMFAALGYTNASWTLKVDLTNEYACRLINYLDREGLQYCSPEATPDLVETPLLNLDSGYIRRGEGMLPKQGDKVPWKLYQNYLYDRFSLKYTSIKDTAMTFGKRQTSN